MSLVRWKNNEGLMPSLSSMIDSFFSGDELFSELEGTGSLPAVNVRDLPGGYELQVAAPGMSREDFDVEIQNDLLFIRAEREASAQTLGTFTRKEFSYHAFERVFRLPAEVDEDSIDASYTDGVLYVRLPRRNATGAVPGRHIEIQ